MNATMKQRIERSAFDLIRYTTRLADDTRVRLVIPLKPATATIAEIMAARS